VVAAALLAVLIPHAGALKKTRAAAERSQAETAIDLDLAVVATRQRGA